MSKEFLTPKRIITGKDAIENSIKYLVTMGKKPLIVTGRVVAELDSVKKLTNGLSEQGLDYSIFKDITGEPTDVMIEKGIDAYRENACDFLIGIGGGSPLDAIKAIAVLSVCGGKLSDYMGKEISGDFPPMAAIPTTAGTGSEATKFTVITDSKTDIKMLLKGESLLPDLAIVDYTNTKSSPKSITASTGLDALTHAVEAYTSKQAQPLTDALALSAVKRIFKYLPIAYTDGDNETARYEMSIAALEAGICINNSSVTIVHGMSRPIGALFHVPHGLSNAMLLCKCMDFAKDGATEQFAKLSRAVGTASDADSDEKAADKFIAGLFDICRKCEVPTISEYGIDINDFLKLVPKMTSDALASGSPSNTRKNVTAEDIEEIYTSLI
ncbi:MAG: iron-containing alcohol dehydrogenase [Clostridiales bacterium]|nr:iron-containing alcohol dehydrogenase [Clostridiales bacterium]